MEENKWVGEEKLIEGQEIKIIRTYKIKRSNSLSLTFSFYVSRPEIS